MSNAVRCVIMRGGTSTAVFLRESDLPVDKGKRKSLILGIFGSPDRRQIDGLGGADPLTSKLAIIGPPRKDPRAAGTHLTYTFGQVEIDAPEIDFLSLCGNISSAVGAFAVYEGMVQPVSPVTTVRAFNTNLNRILSIEVPVENNRPIEQGDFEVPGVPGSGARLLVDPHHQIEAVVVLRPRPEFEHLRKLVGRVDVDDGKGHMAAEGLLGEPDEDVGILAHRPRHGDILESVLRLAKEENRLVLETFQMCHRGNPIEIGGISKKARC